MRHQRRAEVQHREAQYVDDEALAHEPTLLKGIATAEVYLLTAAVLTRRPAA
jgi:hypothetical protein